MKVVGGAVNWNVSPFLIKPEQASVSPMLADHTISAMCSITWIFWIDVKNRERRRRGRIGKRENGNQPCKWFKIAKKRTRSCVLLHSLWAIRFKASGTKLFLEALSLYSLPPQANIHSSWRRLLIRIKFSLLLSCHIPSCPEFNLLAPRPSRFLHFQSIMWRAML